MNLYEVISNKSGVLHPKEFRLLKVGDVVEVEDTLDTSGAFGIRLHKVRGGHGCSHSYIHSAFLREVEMLGDTPRSKLAVVDIPTHVVIRRSDNHILCYGQDASYIGLKIYSPITFPSRAKAVNFTQYGHISDLQEQLGNLDVVFTDQLVQRS